MLVTGTAQQDGTSIGSRPYRGKRAFDLAFVALTCIPAAVIGVACSVAIRLDSSGPIFFRQVRVGQDGHLFVIWKFRTMSHAPGDPSNFPDAERITRVGSILRMTSLDEIPQLINIACGEMSVVGPRPALPYQVARYTPTQRRRLVARPGVTGLAQVSGRNTLSWAQRIEFDLEYCQRQSLRLDLRILAATIHTVVNAVGSQGHPRDDPIAAP
jgi:lipopolysaccharide/colanic/teichoic acid biosynthesis glycosyltransferase